MLSPRILIDNHEKTDVIVPLKLRDIIGTRYNSVKVTHRLQIDSKRIFDKDTYMDPLATVMLRF